MRKTAFRILAAGEAAVLLAAGISVAGGLRASAQNLLSAEFETTNDSFTGRGAASVAWTSDEAYSGNCSLFVSGRTDTWNGASRDMSSLMKAGSTYALSAAVYHSESEPIEMKFSLQYSGADGETQYDEIALETVESGTWTLLSNDDYTVPEGAEDLSVYVETTESLADFYLDSVSVSGPPAVIKPGDSNGDLSVNMEDAILLLKFLTAQEASVEQGADYNGDDRVNAVDLSLLKARLLAPETPGSGIEGDWDHYEETATPEMLKVYQDGLYRIGNTARIREKIAKAQAGEDVTVAYLGGSITAGGSATSNANCFANLSYEYFRDTFGQGGNARYVNAGLAGTSSVVGNLRVDRDVFSQNADVIFIEFAVNDQGGERFQKSFESLVKKCLMQENAPAVIIVTLCQQSGSSNQDWMVQVAENYDLPVISGKNAIMNAIEAGTLTWNDYGSGDTLHPGDGGHRLIADCIGYYYRQALRSENASDAYEIPQSEVFGAEYATAKIEDVSQFPDFQAGSFTKGTNQMNYPDGFTNSKTGNDPLTFTAEGKGILLLFQSNDSAEMGTVNVTVNGVTTPVSANLPWTWGGLDGDVGYYQPESGTLHVSISMQDPNTNFVLYGIAIVT